MDVLSTDHHIDAIVAEFIHPAVERIVTAVWFGIEWFVYKRGLIS